MAKAKKVRIAPFGTFTTGKKSRCLIEQGMAIGDGGDELAIKAMARDGVTPQDFVVQEAHGPLPNYEKSIAESSERK